LAALIFWDSQCHFLSSGLGAQPGRLHLFLEVDRPFLPRHMSHAVFPPVASILRRLAWKTIFAGPLSLELCARQALRGQDGTFLSSIETETLCQPVDLAAGGHSSLIEFAVGGYHVNS